MYGRARRKTVYLSWKQGRDTHPEKKGMGIPCNEERCSKSEVRQRYTSGEKG